MDNFFTKEEELIPGWCPSELAYYLNSLVEEIPPDQYYLEIGTFCGKSLCPALRGNNAKAIVIDPLDLVTEKGTIDELWHKYTAHYRERITLYKERAELFGGTLPPINIFFYDGNHDSGHTYEALNKFTPFVVPNGVIIVDDYNIYGGNAQTPYPGHNIDVIAPVKMDVNRWLSENNKEAKITSWGNSQAIIQL